MCGLALKVGNRPRAVGMFTPRKRDCSSGHVGKIQTSYVPGLLPEVHVRIEHDLLTVEISDL
jgi:hypothetical protein